MTEGFLRLARKWSEGAAAAALRKEADPNYENPKKLTALIMAAEGDEFQESEIWYDHLERHIGWKSIGKVLCGHVAQPGDTKGKPELEKAYNLGKSIK